jgi:hypothetical protein
MNGTDERPLRFCDLCGGLDDHPRHVKQLPPEATDGSPDAAVIAGIKNANEAPMEAVRQLYAENLQVRHMDCCAAAGCETCEATEADYGERRGQELIAYLEEARNG